MAECTAVGAAPADAWLLLPHPDPLPAAPLPARSVSAQPPLVLVTDTTEMLRHICQGHTVADESVVEVGSSYGGCTAVLVSSGAGRVVGLDSSWECITESRRRVPLASFEHVDAFADRAALATVLRRECPTLVVVDIGGNRACADVMDAIDAVRAALPAEGTPRARLMVLVKSEELHAALLRHRVPSPGCSQSAHAWWLEQRQRLAREQGGRVLAAAGALGEGSGADAQLVLDKQAGLCPVLRRPTWYPTRAAADNLPTICRFHNYAVQGCKRYAAAPRCESGPWQGYASMSRQGCTDAAMAS